MSRPATGSALLRGGIWYAVVPLGPPTRRRRYIPTPPREDGKPTTRADAKAHALKMVEQLRGNVAALARDPAAGRGRFIYFIQWAPESPVKIGYTDDLPSRLAALQMACPYKLSASAVVFGNNDMENFLHRRFAALRMSGEWFRPDPELLDLIGKLRRKELGPDEWPKYFGSNAG